MCAIRTIRSKSEEWAFIRYWACTKQFTVTLCGDEHLHAKGSYGDSKTRDLCTFVLKSFRKGTLPDHTPVAPKPRLSLENLQCTAALVAETGVSIGRTRRRHCSIIMRPKNPQITLEVIYCCHFLNMSSCPSV